MKCQNARPEIYRLQLLVADTPEQKKIIFSKLLRSLKDRDPRLWITNEPKG